MQVWLSAWEKSRDVLSGQFISANGDIEGLVERKVEIAENGLLEMDPKGFLGAGQIGQWVFL